jgi:two-component system, cell cycle response regulator DivK
VKNSLNILLVDDDYLLAKGTAKLIQRLGGHQVSIADEPAEIFQVCESGKIDLVMMDVNLPGAQWQGQEVSGTDISRLLKTQPKTASIPIILVTAYAMVTERQPLMRNSLADAFCPKPITDYEALLEMFDRLCQKS